MEKMLHKINSKYIYLAVVIIVGIVIFLLNFFTPLIADDFSHSVLSGTDEKIENISDFVKSNLNYFFTWGGRNVTFAIFQFFLIIDKNYFNVINTLVYIFLIFLIYKHITNEKYNTILFVILNLVLWFVVPAWGQNILWLTGACVYLWSTVFILLFLLPFRYAFDDKNYTLNKIFSMGMFFLGMLAGWSFENSAAAVLFLLIGYVVKKIIKKEKFKLFEILGIMGFIIGFGLLLLAPGNYARLDNHETGSLVYELFKRFSLITAKFFEKFILFIFVFCFLFVELLQQKKIKKGITAYIYLLGGLASLYSMIAAPYFPDRSRFIGVIFFTIAVCNLAKHVVFDKQIIHFYTIVLITITFLYFPVTFYRAGRDIIGIYINWNNRIEYIYEQKEKGNYKIEVEPIYAYDKHAALYDLVDLEWASGSIADYFGIEEIKIKTED